MQKLKSVFKGVNWLRVFWLVSGFTSVMFLFGCLGLLVCYFPLVGIDIFGPVSYCGLCFGLFLLFSLLSSSCYDELIELKTKDS